MFSVPEVLEGISQGESAAESDDGLSGLESADSFSEDIFNDELDPLLDFQKNIKIASSAQKKAKKTTVAQGLEEIYQDDSGEESDVQSGLDSADSFSEDAFDDGLDPLLDLEDIEEPPAPSTPSTSAEVPTPPSRSTPPHSTRPVRGRKRRSLHPPAEEPEDRWKTEAEQDVKPEKFRFNPARTPGAQLDTSKTYSPLDLFQLFFGMAVMRTLCNNTNKNAIKRKARGIKSEWQPVSIVDMYNYIGILIYMGLLTSHNVRDYWTPRVPYDVPFCRSIMTRTRFEAISWTLHLSDPEEDRENDLKKGTSDYDPLFHLRPLFDSILTACRLFYQPRQNLFIDERMVASKTSFRQYMKGKPTKWGFKLFVLADASTGYTCDFSIYTGKSPSATGKGLSYDSVMNLMRVSYLGTGYNVYVDNINTSSALFQDLFKMKFGACGTIRENRVGFPRTKQNTLPKKAERGSLRWIRSGELLFTKWMDTRVVTMCSTIHKAYSGETVQRKVKKPDGSSQVQAIPIPDTVKDYSRHMGGVGLSDALIQYYILAHKTRKWYKKLFFHFIDIAVVNSFLLHKELAESQSFQALTHKKFREELCKQLGSVGVEEQQEASTSTAAGCFPIAISQGQVVDPSRKTTIGRKICVVCAKKKHKIKTPWKCERCDVALCLIVDRNCFREWHQKKRK
uniref:Si:dkey-19f4.2 n=1 Tax=Lepisosteus oculatus TaxID=7918 RepID=W5N8P6_LEPOC